MGRTKTFEWRASSREERIRDLDSILLSLCSRETQYRPDVIVFSEYSFPKEALKQLSLQAFADNSQAVIVCGSFFDNDKDSPTYRHNVCHTYIPGRNEPIAICKYHSSPEEDGVLNSGHALANVLRLVWQPSEERAVSISVFLCRDYLSPFNAMPTSIDEEGRVLDRISLLDWDREGINIVVMNNLDPTLFQAAAAFDVRRTHGERKLVLLVNSANQQDLLATAILGASQEPDRQADIAAKIDAKEEGVLLVNTRLSNVAGTRSVPDRQTSFPISFWQAEALDRKSDDLFRPIKTQKTIAKRRGVFHPAFLEVMQKRPVIDFYVAKDVSRVNRVFSEGRIQHVSAGFVRGIEDVVVRRYVDRYLEGNSDEEMTVPFSYLTKEEFGRAFDVGRTSRHLRLIVEPRGILKTRGAIVPDYSDEDWLALLAKLGTLEAGRFGSDICRVARDLPVDENITGRLAPIFELGVEDVIPIGTDLLGQIRDTFILVVAEDADGSSARKRFLIYIKENLNPDRRVRDIFSLAQAIDYRGSSKFEFILRLKCNVFEVDKVIDGMQNWASKNGIRLGTRTYDLWRHISRGSVDGIIGSHMKHSEVNLLREILQFDSEAVWTLNRQLREGLADCLERNLLELRWIGSTDKYLRGFLINAILFNLTSQQHKTDRFFDESQNQWGNLFKFAEDRAKALLVRALKMPDDARNNDIAKNLQSILGERFAESKEASQADPLRMFVRFYPDIQPDVDPDLVKLVRQAVSDLTPSRNWAQHGGNKVPWKTFISLRDESWKDDLRRLDSNTTLMQRLDRGLYDESTRFGFSS